MKANLSNPANQTKYAQRYDAAKNLLETDAPDAAVAAQLIQLTVSSRGKADPRGFKGQQGVVKDLVLHCGSPHETRNDAVLVVANSVLRASAEITDEHEDILVSAAASRPTRASRSTPSPEVARAFLSEFMGAGIAAGQRGAHNDWFVNLGPGSGKTFYEAPSAEAVEARAADLAGKDNVPVSKEHRLVAADQLAKEIKFSSGDGAGSAGRLFGLPYDMLEQVGGFGLEKANANNATSVEAAAIGLLAHLSGKDVQIDQDSSASEYQQALNNKLGDLDGLKDELNAPGRSWSQLSETEQSDTIEYFADMLGELAELRLGLREYEGLSPATLNALSTTHDVYVQMRAPGLFTDDWGKAQAVPLNQLDKVTKDGDIPPFLFALNGMVSDAKQQLAMSVAS